MSFHELPTKSPKVLQRIAIPPQQVAKLLFQRGVVRQTVPNSIQSSTQEHRRCGLVEKGGEATAANDNHWLGERQTTQRRSAHADNDVSSCVGRPRVEYRSSQKDSLATQFGVSLCCQFLEEGPG